MLAVALEGLDNILKAGENHFTKMGYPNRFALVLENEGGLELIEQLQIHPNHQIYQRALKILENYYQPEDEGFLGGTAATPGEGQGSTYDDGKAQFKF